MSNQCLIRLLENEAASRLTTFPSRVKSAKGSSMNSLIFAIRSGAVASEVAKWPPETSRPVLEAALICQKKAGAGEIARVIAKTLAGIKGK